MRTRQIMLDSVKKILEKKQFDDITVQDILDEAGVARKTFYRYFNDKYDIVNAYYNDYITQNIIPHRGKKNYYELSIDIYNFIKENRKYFKNAMNSEKDGNLFDFLYKTAVSGYLEYYYENNDSADIDEETKFKMEIFAHQSVFCVKKWVNEGCKIPSETLVEWMRDISCDIGKIIKDTKN